MTLHLYATQVLLVTTRCVYEGVNIHIELLMQAAIIFLQLCHISYLYVLLLWFLIIITLW